LSAWLWNRSQLNTYTTGIGEQRSIILQDGSTVDLNAQSRVRIVYGARERRVELAEGQALFRVAKDAARPFVVRAGTTDIRAVGTQFDVYRKTAGTVVTVVEGRVAVLPFTLPARRSIRPGAADPADVTEESAPPPTRTILSAGEQVIVGALSTQKAQHADVAAATAWTQKQIIFRSTPLSEVVSEFNRYNARQLVITDPDIGGTRISGVFSSTDPGSLLRGLTVLGSFRIHSLSDRIEISGT
jgi:transmembrane sensor